jgi:hypothetical protein
MTLSRSFVFLKSFERFGVYLRQKVTNRTVRLPQNPTKTIGIKQKAAVFVSQRKS